MYRMNEMIGSTLRLTLAGAIILALLAGCGKDDGKLGEGTSREEPVRESVQVLHDFPGVDEFKAGFNRDAGQPRIILLLSPT